MKGNLWSINLHCLTDATELPCLVRLSKQNEQQSRRVPPGNATILASVARVHMGSLDHKWTYRLDKTKRGIMLVNAA